MSNYYYITPEEYEIALKNGIKKEVVYQRVYRYGWTIKKAITTPTRKRDMSYKKKNLYVETALKNGISANAYYARLRRGWSKEKASTTKLKNK